MRLTDCSCFSIRLIFSIADIQADQEAEFEEGEEPADGAEDAEAPLHSYPIRCSFSFTKVRLWDIHGLSSWRASDQASRVRSSHQRRVP